MSAPTKLLTGLLLSATLAGCAVGLTPVDPTQRRDVYLPPPEDVSEPIGPDDGSDPPLDAEHDASVELDTGPVDAAADSASTGCTEAGLPYHPTTREVVCPPYERPAVFFVP